MTTYALAVTDLLTDRLPELGPGKPNRKVHEILGIQTPESICPGFADYEMAMCCLSALWLYHDFLDESHRISQDIDTPTGSYLHAIMHRREPDASNSKYWFRHVGSHPVFDMLAEQAPHLGYNYTTPFDFVDFCERVRNTGSGQEDLARRVQLLEWQLLFDYCYQKAVAG